MGETYGESATLVSAMGSAYISGMQGEDRKTGMAACAKHFLGYASSEAGLNMAGSHMGPRELREVYAKPFAAAIDEANLQGIMNCYLALDGEPVTGSRKYLTGLLREELGFSGLTIADYGSMDKLCDVYHTAKDKAEAGEQALRAGLDTETPRRICLGDDFVERLEKGEIPMEVVDTPLRRLLTLKFELGLFEQPYADYEKMKQVYQQEARLETSYQLACESMTLLKNKDQILPLKNRKKIAVIGPNAHTYRALMGGYTQPAFYEGMHNMLLGISKSMGLEGVSAQSEQKAYLETILSQMPDVETLIKESYPGIQTVYESIRQLAEELLPGAEVSFAEGCPHMEEDRSGFAEARQLAAESDVVIFVCGGRNGSSTGCTMGENVDTSHIGLPGVQEELAKELVATSTPLVVLHMDGKPLSSLWIKEYAAALLEAWHPGQMGAKAIADTLFGRNNPCGKLPVTALRHTGQIPIYAEQNRGCGALGRGMGNNNIHQGYVDEPGFPLYPFGYGMSYTEFSISQAEISQETMDAKGSVIVSCVVTNTGEVSGDEIVQLYFCDKIASVIRPQMELAGFARVTLAPGESKQVAFQFMADQTAFVDADMKWRVEQGEVELKIGDSSDNLMTAGTVCITETSILPDGHRTYYATQCTEERRSAK